MNNLFDTFQQHFSVVPADTQELSFKAHALRYQVYCIENPFEDPGQHPNGKEMDQYDHRSVQSLVNHMGSGDAVGCVRLILHEECNPDALFPVFETV